MAVLYADVITDSIRAAVDETTRRRAIQEAYNREHGITPTTITKAIRDLAPDLGYVDSDYLDLSAVANSAIGKGKKKGRVHKEDIPATLEKMREKMLGHAKNMEFEEAAALRDQIKALEAQSLY